MSGGRAVRGHRMRESGGLRLVGKVAFHNQT